MFGEQFYPTPRGVIEKMLEPWSGTRMRSMGWDGHYKEKGFPGLHGKTILDPSAGSGAILDYITGKYVTHSELWDESRPERGFRETYSPDNADRKKIYACELDPNLRHILQGKDYRVIADDFLEYTGDQYFDIILMNPPFANGDEHLLKAWEILEEGEIACLLNSETLNNPYTARRKQVQHLVNTCGSMEELGKVFMEADRKTDVNVSLVRLKKVRTKSKLDFDFGGVNREDSFHIDESVINDAPALKDIIGNMLIQYEKIKEGFVEYMKIAAQLDHYGSPLVSRNTDKETGKEKVEHQISIFSLAQKAFEEGNGRRDSHNIFTGCLKKHMWKIVMTNINNISSFDMEQFMTHSVRQNFSEFSAKQGDMDFTRENVWNMITMLFENRETILEKAVGEVFDIFTSYHKENRNYVEGWKTNSKYKVNRKIILPNGVKYGEYMSTYDLAQYGDTFKINYNSESKYSDIDKVMCYLTGKKTKDIVTINRGLESHFRVLGNVKNGTFDNVCQSEFFDIRFFKKGTLHLTFRDVALWDEFNIRACLFKQWLPENEEREYRKRKTRPKEWTNQLRLEEACELELEEDFQL